MKSTSLAFFLLICGTALAQRNNLTKYATPDGKWSEGKVTLLDGSALSGMVLYNTRTSLVSLEAGSISRSFSAKTAQGFEFFDQDSLKNRQFFSLRTKDPITDGETDAFFEVLRQYNAFAVLLKTDRLNVQVKRKTSAYAQQYQTGVEADQAETLFLLGESAGMQPVIEIKRFGRASGKKEFSKVKATFNEENLNLFLAGKQPDAMRYIDEKGLDLRKPADLLTLLDHLFKS
jgi:hypothetical protein